MPVAMRKQGRIAWRLETCNSPEAPAAVRARAGVRVAEWLRYVEGRNGPAQATWSRTAAELHIARGCGQQKAPIYGAFLEPTRGLEPRTPSLRVKCSTS